MTFIELAESILSNPVDFIAPRDAGEKFFNIEITDSRVSLMGKYNSSAISALPTALKSTGTLDSNGFTSFEATTTIPVKADDPDGKCWIIRLVYT